MKRGDLLVRAVEPADLRAVHEIEAASFGTPWSEETFERLLDRDTLDFVALVDGNEVIGYAVVWCIVDQGELSNIAIAPEHRGRGLGRTLLDEVISRIRRRGVTRLFLEVRASNEPALGLYASLGFAVVGRRKEYYQNPREDALLMTLPIP